ncbi:MAG: hypothetical protein PWP52_667 [Bacteroidales bacterium]|nr:hypothetical protein [Bacteroidales bacterium]
MSLQAAIKRLSLIIDKVSRSHYPTKKEILKYVRDTGIKISDRTLDRDIEKLRDEFGVELIYDIPKNGYYIDKENSLEFSSFLRLIELNETADLITTSLKEGKENFKYIDFETSSDFKGVQQLKDLYKAILSCHYISFYHTNYHTDVTKKFFNMEPYLLKEYQNRWYLVARMKGFKNFITFGVDRITHLEINDEKFTRADDMKVHELFSEIIGLVYSTSDVEEVLMKVDEKQVKYFESLPWHESQDIFIKNGKTFMRLYVRPNFELIQKIMMQGEFIEVLKPEWLRNKIAQLHLNTAKKYGQ